MSLHFSWRFFSTEEEVRLLLFFIIIENNYYCLRDLFKSKHATGTPTHIIQVIFT